MTEIPRTFPACEAWRGLVAFEVRGRPKTFVDVVQAAETRGALAPIVRLSAAARRAELRAESEGLEADMDAVGKAIDDFRYSHGLETVEETERWLGRFGLGVDDLTGHFLRRYWLKAMPGGGAAEAEADVDLGVDLGDPVWHVDLVLEGVLERLAKALAFEEVCRLDHEAPNAETAAGMLAGLRRERGWTEAEYDGWRRDWGLEEERVLGFLQGESLYREVCLSVLSDGAKARFLAEQSSAMWRLDLEVVEFDSLPAAQEAYLCVTADRMEVETVAMESGFPLTRRVAFPRELPELWQGLVMSAAEGETLQPFAGDGRFSLVRVRERRQPDLSDPKVMAEVEARLLHRHFCQVEMREIRWRMGVVV